MYIYAPVLNSSTPSPPSSPQVPLYSDHLLISIRTYATVLIIESTVDIGTVVEGTISLLHWSSPPLVHEVPMETCERSVLVTLVLQKSFALLHTKLLQVPCRPGGVAWCMCIGRRTIDTFAGSDFISIEAKTRGNYRAVSLATAMWNSDY